MYPKKLTPVLNRLSGYNTNLYKIMPVNADDISSGKIISVRLPTNALVDLSTFAMHFDIDLTGTGARMPNKLSTLIERVEVLCGGQTIQQGFNGYGTAKHIKETVEGSSCLGMSRQVLNHPKIVGGDTDLSVVDVYGNVMLPTSHESYDEGPSFIMNNWMGFLGECVPRVLDLGLMSEMQIRITLANKNVLVKAGSSSDPSEFKLKSVYFTVNTLSVDGVYEQLIEGKIKRDGYIEIPYKNYFSSFANHGSNTRFSNSSQSIDKIYTVLRDSSTSTGYQTIGEAVTVAGMGPLELDEMGNQAFPHKLARYLNFAARETTSASGAATTTFTPIVTEWQYQINNVMYPQYRAKPLDAYRCLEMAADKKTLEIPSTRQFLDHYAIFPVTLCADNEIGHINGFDSRNTNSIMEFQTNSVPDNRESFVLVETTATLKIGAGKAMEIVL